MSIGPAQEKPSGTRPSKAELPGNRSPKKKTRPDESVPGSSATVHSVTQSVFQTAPHFGPVCPPRTLSPFTFWPPQTPPSQVPQFPSAPLFQTTSDPQIVPIWLPETSPTTPYSFPTPQSSCPNPALVPYRSLHSAASPVSAPLTPFNLPDDVIPENRLEVPPTLRRIMQTLGEKLWRLSRASLGHQFWVPVVTLRQTLYLSGKENGAASIFEFSYRKDLHELATLLERPYDPNLDEDLRRACLAAPVSAGQFQDCVDSYFGRRGCSFVATPQLAYGFQTGQFAFRSLEQVAVLFNLANVESSAPIHQVISAAVDAFSYADVWKYLFRTPPSPFSDYLSDRLLFCEQDLSKMHGKLAGLCLAHLSSPSLESGKHKASAISHMFSRLKEKFEQDVEIYKLNDTRFSDRTEEHMQQLMARNKYLMARKYYVPYYTMMAHVSGVESSQARFCHDSDSRDPIQYFPDALVAYIPAAQRNSVASLLQGVRIPAFSSRESLDFGEAMNVLTKGLRETASEELMDLGKEEAVPSLKDLRTFVLKYLNKVSESCRTIEKWYRTPLEVAEQESLKVKLREIYDQFLPQKRGCIARLASVFHLQFCDEEMKTVWLYPPKTHPIRQYVEVDFGYQSHPTSVPKTLVKDCIVWKYLRKQQNKIRPSHLSCFWTENDPIEKHCSSSDIIEIYRLIVQTQNEKLFQYFIKVLLMADTTKSVPPPMLSYLLPTEVEGFVDKILAVHLEFKNTFRLQSNFLRKIFMMPLYDCEETKSSVAKILIERLQKSPHDVLEMISPFEGREPVFRVSDAVLFKAVRNCLQSKAPSGIILRLPEDEVEVAPRSLDYKSPGQIAERIRSAFSFPLQELPAKKVLKPLERLTMDSLRIPQGISPEFDYASFEREFAQGSVEEIVEKVSSLSAAPVEMAAIAVWWKFSGVLSPEDSRCSEIARIFKEKLTDRWAKTESYASSWSRARYILRHFVNVMSEEELDENVCQAICLALSGLKK